MAGLIDFASERIGPNGLVQMLPVMRLPACMPVAASVHYDLWSDILTPYFHVGAGVDVGGGGCYMDTDRPTRVISLRVDLRVFWDCCAA